jgi:putative membrane protein PagO
MSLRLKIYAGFIIICLLWGSSWAAVKLGLESIPPILSLGLRLSLASMILGVIIVLRRLQVPTDRKFWSLVFILCGTSFTIPFVMIYWAQIHVNSGLAAVLFATFPLWVAVLSHFILPHEQLTFSRIVGIGIGFIGVIVIFNKSFFNMTSTTFLSMSAIIMGAIIQASGLVALRKLGEKMHPVMLNFWPMLISTIVLFLASLVTEDYSNIQFDPKVIISLIYLSILCTVITFVIYFFLVKHIEAVILSLSAFVTPVIAMFIGVLVMGEDLTATVTLGSLIVLIGVGIATLGDYMTRRRQRQRNPAA